MNMSESNWNKVEFQDFINDFGIEIIIKNAPVILFSKQDKEKEAKYSLYIFLVLFGSLVIFLAVSIGMSLYFYSDILGLSLVILIALSISSIFFLINYSLSNFYIKPIECWVEIFRTIYPNNQNYYCFIYYPVFSGKCHPNEAINIIYKLYQEEVYGTTIDITKIEVYLKLDKIDHYKNEKMGFFFRYAGGSSFKSENIQECVWKFFPFKKSLEENYIAIGNWAHYYEWRFDLALDYDKLESYSPWLIKKWDKTNLKPLTNDFKYKIKWKKKFEDLEPHIIPEQIKNNEDISLKPKMDNDMEIVKNAIKILIGEEIKVNNNKDIREKLFEFRAFFRDLNH
ncbi:MAG: hypothetical protein KGD63_09035 [Candidatus Lokiarchaeota archaeon]|nr:hypothetical protein [Candidatus Lokiarchaeota archaeon]